MESEKLKEIYKELKSFCKENNIETGKSGYLMGLFTKYHRALSQHDVIKNEVSVCLHANILRSDGLDECLDCGAKNY